MAERRTKDGVVYERRADGQWAVVGYETVPLGGQDPRDRVQSATADTQVAQAGATLDNTRTNIADTAVDNSRMGTAQNFDFESTLRKEFEGLPETTQFHTVIRQFASALKTQPTPSGDQALITAYAKILDPGSVVREQEFATAADADSAIGKVIAKIKKEGGFDDAGLIRPQIRTNILREMQNLSLGYGDLYDQKRNQYTRLATARQIEPWRVVGEDARKPFSEDIAKFGAKLREDMGGPVPPGGFAAPGAESKSIAIPPQMQAEYEAMVQQGRGRLDPDQYARQRLDLAEKYGFGRNEEQYSTFIEEAHRLNKDALSGAPLNLQIPPVDADMSNRDRFNNAAFNNTAGGFALGVADMTGGIDEASAGVSSLINGTDYSVELDRANALKQKLRGEYPVASTLGTITGAGATGLGLAGMVPKLAALAATPGGAAATGVITGGAQGALEGNDNRLLGAGVGAGVGGLGGFAGQKVIAPGIGKIVDRFSDAPKLSGAQRTVADALDLNSIDSARQNVTDAQRLGLPFTLADSAPKLRGLAGSATRLAPDALARAEPMLESRSLGQVERANSAISDHLAQPTDIIEQAKRLRQAGNIEAGPKYAEAFASDIPIDPRVASILQTRTGRDALKEAQGIASDNQVDLGKLGFQTDEAGEMFLNEAPKLEALDLVKKGMDASLQKSANPVTGAIDFNGRPDLQAIEGLRKRFVGTLDELSPTYKEARGTFAPFAQRAEALDRGKAARARNLAPRDLDRITSDLAPIALPEFRTGFATGLSDDVNNAALGGNPYKRIYGSQAQQEKVGSLFPEGAADFGRVVSLEDEMAKTSREVLGGSPTARRQAADDAFAPSLVGDVAQDAAMSAISGTPIPMATARAGLRTMFSDGRQFGMGDRGRKRAGEVADLLLSPDTDLNSITGARAQQLVRDAEIRRRLALGVPLALPALSAPLIQSIAN
jgi:hypothetical protein